MRPYIQGEALPKCVSISEADLKNGSPKVGDMIARNPKNPDDQWLVAEKYFNDNLELAPSPDEVAKLRKYVEKLEIYSPENEWSQPEWRKLIGSKEEQEDPETLFKVYQFRFEPDIRGETNEVARLREENAALKQGKVFVDPKWIYDLETQLAKAHEELCQAGLREYGN